MEIEDKRLFLRYAIPCADTLVKRGWVARERIEKLRRAVKDGLHIQDDVGEIFLVAYANLKLMAMEKGRKGIDSKLIREYYWKRHESVVSARYSEMGDFDPVGCVIYPGKVVGFPRDRVAVDTPRGVVEASNDFTPGLKPGDYVAVHYDCIAERIPKDVALSLWEWKRETAERMKKFKLGKQDK